MCARVLNKFFFGGFGMKSLQRYVWMLLLFSGLGSMAFGAVWTVSPWTDDASTGIDSGSTYTHAVNFTDDKSPAVNGLTFTPSHDSHSGTNWTYNGSGVWLFRNDNDNNITGAGAELGNEFEVTPASRFPMTLSGLTPNTLYEITLFSTGWDDAGPRNVTLTHDGSYFTFDQNAYGKNNGLKVVGIYQSDADGKFNLFITGSSYNNDGRSLHLYAFANRAYAGPLPVRVFPAAPADYSIGKRVGTDTRLSWIEGVPGSLTEPMFDVYMDPNETLVTELSPAALAGAQQSAFSFDPDLDYGLRYYWRVVTYVNGEPNQVTDLRSFETVYADEHWSGTPWTDDSNIEVSAGKLYTHKVNFNASQSTTTYVNGVHFENDNDRAGQNWILSGAGSSASGGHHVTGDGGALVSRIWHGQNAVLKLTGLVPGTDYVLTKYTRGWGNPGGREVRITTSADGRTTVLDGNILGDGNGYLWKYTYTAPASGELTLTFDPLVSNDTWHHYAFSNEAAFQAYVDPAPLPGASVNSDVELSWVLRGDVLNPTYNLKIATDAGMANLVLDETGLTTASRTPYLSSDTTYYWQVEIVEDGAAVIYTSPVWSFVTTPPQDAVKVIEWKFDETTGLIAEQTGPTEDADGVLVGFDDPNTPGVSHVAGLVNNGLLLNGKDEYVNVSNAFVYMPTANGQSFGISGYLRTFDNYGPLFSMRNSTDENPIIDIALGMDGVQNRAGRVCLLVRDDAGSMSNVNSGVMVNDGRWHHFAVTRVEGKWTLYVDGISRATINGAATGEVTLDFMAIGTSLKWIADDWQNENTHFRDFKGILDEYTVWNGELLPHQIAELASILPPQGDIDFDLDADQDDLSAMTEQWLADTRTAVQERVVLEDMETYDISDPNTYQDHWPYAPKDGYGALVLTVIPDPNDGIYGQVMRMDYDFTGENSGIHAFSHVKVVNRGADLGLFDSIEFRIKKLTGCDVPHIILDYYDGRFKADPTEADLYNKGRMTIDIEDVPENEWAVVSGTFPDDVDLKSCADLYEILFSIRVGQALTGTLLIDSIELVDGTENCVLAVGQMVPDINGDCDVNMLDFAELAENWQRTGSRGFNGH